MLYFDVECGLVGDALSAIPYIMHHYAQDTAGPSYIGMDFNPWVLEGIRWPFYLRHLPGPSVPPEAKIIPVKPTIAWNHGHSHGWPGHMAEMHFAAAKIKPERNVFAIPLKRAYNVNFFPDVVMAPFSITNSPDNNKKWPDHYWSDFIRWANQHGMRVTVLGSATDDVSPYVAAGAEPFQGHPLAEVVDVLARCRLLVSVDTGIGHLGTMLNMRNHVMIYGRCLPPKFAETPFGQNVYGAFPRSIQPASVIAAAKKVLDSVQVPHYTPVTFS